MARAIVTMPKTAAKGEVIQIRTLIAHPMETGYRPGDDGRIVPRNILRRFVCRYGDEVVFEADLYPAVAANPLVAFHTVATTSATLTFTWEGDNGFAQTETATLMVT
ncbi:MAG: thiosulfate oxidation carrier complex protein SoxZ [Proteobacteria bacterium]|nr:thiosulfate oxidation carrier complex protein SoxZ [Pseudomonadota bacterium]